MGRLRKIKKLTHLAKIVYIVNTNKKFIKEFKSLSDINLVLELQEEWDNWHKTTFEYDSTKKYAERLFTIVKTLNKKHFN